MKDYCDYLGQILGVDQMMLDRLDHEMEKRVGRRALYKVAYENRMVIEVTLDTLDSRSPEDARSAAHVRGVLRKTVFRHEEQFMKFLEGVPGKTEFEKAANLARDIARVGKGFFLKRERAEDILRKRKPENVLKYLGAPDIETLLSRYDVTELFSTLRFMESQEWMHETFEEAYSHFTPDDFEERDITIKVLGDEWHEVAKQFVAKKHHNEISPGCI